MVTVEVSGPGARLLFANEPGGHRWQHVPKNERKGKVHTSTVTVAVLAPEPNLPPLRASDVEEELFRRAAGAGGQHNNKTATACRLLHKPTGLRVECSSERAQSQNRATALRWLTAKVADQARQVAGDARARDRRAQVGTGQRGDAIRTYRVRDDQVVTRSSGRKVRLADVLDGAIWLLTD